MKIWLDDLCNDSTSDRKTPIGWIGVENPLIAIKLIESNEVTHISFDHDLAFVKDGVEHTGYDVAKYIEEMAYYWRIFPIIWDVHSSNGPGRDNITRAMQNADKYWKGDK
jgi:hypothetical protein